MMRYQPDAEQELMLGLCLHRDPAAAIQRWREWKARVNLDDLDTACFQLTSLVYLRVTELGIADPDLGRLKGLHRYRWTQGQVAWRAKRALMRDLRRENVAVMLMNGGAVARLAYPDPAARGLYDTEVMVPVNAAAGAVKALEGRGWMPRGFNPQNAQAVPACTLLHADHGEVRLRWRTVARMNGPGGPEDAWWEGAQLADIDDMQVHLPSPADQIVNACESAMDAASRHGWQWLADCTFLIRNAVPGVDWARLVEQARRYQLALPIQWTLRYLRERFEPAIPAGALADLAQIPVPLDSRIEYLLATRPAASRDDLTHKFGVAACRYLRMGSAGWARQFRHDMPRLVRVLSRSMAR